MRRSFLVLACALVIGACTSSSGSSPCGADDVECQCAHSARVALAVPTPGGECAPDGLVCGTEGIVECAGPNLCQDPPTCTCVAGHFSCKAETRACDSVKCPAADGGVDADDADAGSTDATPEAG